MLASIDDVVKILISSGTVPEDSPVLREDLALILDATDAWVHKAYDAGWDSPVNSVVTQKFFDVAQDALIKLGDMNPTNISIKLFAESPDALISDLFDHNDNFLYLGDGVIRLTPSIYVAVPAFPTVWAKRNLRHFIEVDVTYTASGVVPSPVRYAVALIAAAAYVQQETDISNLRGEAIGGYSYSVYELARAANQGIVIPERARRYLQPYIRGLSARAI